jgi:hypothetical protein
MSAENILSELALVQALQNGLPISIGQLNQLAKRDPQRMYNYVVPKGIYQNHGIRVESLNSYKHIITRAFQQAPSIQIGKAGQGWLRNEYNQVGYRSLVGTHFLAEFNDGLYKGMSAERFFTTKGTVQSTVILDLLPTSGVPIILKALGVDDSRRYGWQLVNLNGAWYLNRIAYHSNDVSEPIKLDPSIITQVRLDTPIPEVELTPDGEFIVIYTDPNHNSTTICIGNMPTNPEQLTHDLIAGKPIIEGTINQDTQQI